MKNLVVLAVAILVIPLGAKAQSKCSALKCKDGQSKTETPYGYECRKKGTNIKHGPFCRDGGFYKDQESLGKVTYRGNYKEGSRSGRYTEKVGAVVVNEKNYKDNKLSGLLIKRDLVTGQILKKGIFKNNRGNGTFTYFNKDGVKLSEEVWEEGKYLQEKRFFYNSKTGNLKKIEIDNKNGDSLNTQYLDDSENLNFDEKGRVVKEVYSEDGVQLWSDTVINGKLTRLYSAHPREVGACKIVKKGNEYALEINGETFAESTVELSLINVIKKKDFICKKFKKNQSIKGCLIPKKLTSTSSEAKLKVGSGALGSARPGMMSAHIFADALEAAYNLSSVDMCARLSENKCHATFIEPAERDPQSKSDKNYKILLQQGSQTHEIRPQSKTAMYYLSRILFASKCKKTFKRGKYCKVTSIDNETSEDATDTQYSFSFAGKPVHQNDFYLADRLHVSWSDKLCKDGAINKCQLHEKIKGDDITFSLRINGALACSGDDCSTKFPIADKHKGKKKFQEDMMARFPEFVLANGCFYKEGFGSRWFNNIAGSYYTSENERLRDELRRTLDGKKIDREHNDGSQIGEIKTTDQ